MASPFSAERLTGGAGGANTLTRPPRRRAATTASSPTTIPAVGAAAVHPPGQTMMATGAAPASAAPGGNPLSPLLAQVGAGGATRGGLSQTGQAGQLFGGLPASAQPRTTAAPTAAAPSAPSVSTAPLQTFAPGSDLRFTQVNPTPSAATTAYGSALLSGATGLTPGAAVSPTDSAALAQYRQQTQQAASALTDAPDRLAMAREALADFDTATAPQLAARIRAVGQNAAKFGRIGAGMTTSALGDVESDYERNRLLARNEFLRDALDATQTDRLNNLGALATLTGQTQGLEQATRDEARGERAYGDNFNFARLGLLGDLYGQQDAMDRTARNEIRDERDYQYGTSRDAVEDSYRSALFDQGQQAQDFAQYLNLLSLGFGGNPSSAYADAAYNAGAGAAQNQQATNDFLTNIFRRSPSGGR